MNSRQHIWSGLKVGVLEQFKVKPTTVKNPHPIKILQRHFYSMLGSISTNNLQETNADRNVQMTEKLMELQTVIKEKSVL